jgi:hypothetical protein
MSFIRCISLYLKISQYLTAFLDSCQVYILHRHNSFRFALFIIKGVYHVNHATVNDSSRDSGRSKQAQSPLAIARIQHGGRNFVGAKLRDMPPVFLRSPAKNTSLSPPVAATIRIASDLQRQIAARPCSPFLSRRQAATEGRSKQAQVAAADLCASVSSASRLRIAARGISRYTAKGKAMLFPNQPGRIYNETICGGFYQYFCCSRRFFRQRDCPSARAKLDK